MYGEMRVGDIKKRLELFDDDQIIKIGHEGKGDAMDISGIVEENDGTVVIEIAKHEEEGRG